MRGRRLPALPQRGYRVDQRVSTWRHFESPLVPTARGAIPASWRQRRQGLALLGFARSSCGRDAGLHPHPHSSSRAEDPIFVAGCAKSSSAPGTHGRPLPFLWVEAVSAGRGRARDGRPALYRRRCLDALLLTFGEIANWSLSDGGSRARAAQHSVVTGLSGGEPAGADFSEAGFPLLCTVPRTRRIPRAAIRARTALLPPSACQVRVRRAASADRVSACRAVFAVTRSVRWVAEIDRVDKVSTTPRFRSLPCLRHLLPLRS